MLPSSWLGSDAVHWDENSPGLVMRTDISSARILVFADNPIPTTRDSSLGIKANVEDPELLYYFELEILSNVNDGGSSEIVVGLVPIDSVYEKNKNHLDTFNSFRDAKDSVCYSSNGMICKGDIQVEATKFGTHDVIGCGCEMGKGGLFFTCNGKIIEGAARHISIDLRSTTKVYFPAVELVGIGATVRANFGDHGFQYCDQKHPVINRTTRPSDQKKHCSMSMIETDAQSKKEPVAKPSLGHAQSHSFISRISHQLSQPLFRHTQSEPNHTIQSDHKINSHSDDIMAAIASALSFESGPPAASLATPNTWTDVDAAQALEALLLLREMLHVNSPEGNHEFEAMSALRDTLANLQVRLRLAIDHSPENETFLELNDMITSVLKDANGVKAAISSAGNSFTEKSEGVEIESQSHTSHSPVPSIVSIMYMLRRGTKDEVLSSVNQLLCICGNQDGEVCDPEVTKRTIKEIRGAGGLQTLLSTLLRCSEWPEVELQISIAVAILVAHETDWHVLMKESHDVLSSMQVLLLRGGDIQQKLSLLPKSMDENCIVKGCNIRGLVSSAVERFCLLMCEECQKDLSHSSINDQNNISELSIDILSVSSTPKHHAMDDAYLGRTLETLSYIIQSVCDDSSLRSSQNTKSHQGLAADSFQSVQESISSPYSSFSSPRRSRAMSCANGKCNGIEESLHDSSLPSRRDFLIRSQSFPDLNRSTRLKRKDSSASNNELNGNDVQCPIIDDVVVICSSAVSKLCQIEKFRASLVSGDMLALLIKWLQDSTTSLEHYISDTGDNCLYGDDNKILKLTKNVTSALAFITAANDSSAARPHTRHSNYTTGWIDAQAMAVELHVVATRFFNVLSSGINIRHCCSSEIFSSLEKFGVSTLLYSLISLANRSQNRASLLSCGLPSSVVRLLVELINKIKSLQNDAVVSAAPSDSEGSEFCSEDIKTQWNDFSRYHEIGGHCLNLLSYFVADCVADIPAKPSLSGVAGAPPAVVDLISQSEVIHAIMHLISLPPCAARLQAVRIISMIVEWQQPMEQIFQEGVSTALAVLLEDANEYFDRDSAPKTSHVERDNSQGSQGSKGSRTSSQPSEVDVPKVDTSHIMLEETVRACFSLANLCHTKLSYSVQFFENGLMTIMLRTVRNDHIEVQRQAVRCISGMCPVLSVLTPGAHPSLMIAAMKSETSMLNPTRSQSGSVNETRALAKKLHYNVIDCVNALRALSHALSSPNVLIKHEALRGISHLAKDDHLRVGIVEGPLQMITALLLDPQCETELKQLAEAVLVNIGFKGGREDLDVVRNDPNLLSEWFYIRRSLRLQKSCHDLLNHWINGLFFGCDVAEKRAKQLYIAELGREATLAENVDEDSLFLHFPDGIDIDIRDTVDLVGLSVVTNVIEKIVGKRKQKQYFTVQDTLPHTTQHRQSANLREALLLQFTHLFDAWKLLRYPQVSSTSNFATEIFASASSNEWIKEKSENYFNFSPANGVKKKKGHITERFFAFMTFCTGKGAQTVINEEETENLENDQPAAQEMERQDTNKKDLPLNLSNYDYSLGDLSDVLNFPPKKVAEFLELLFPSRLHQALVCDWCSVGKVQDNSIHPHLLQRFSTPPRSSQDIKLFKVPEPKQFRCIILPSRTYFSFREGRVLKRILEDVASVDKNDTSVEASSIGGYTDINKTLWALTFRDSIFHGEFIMSLLNALRSLPQISSISFVCKSPQDDSELGYFGGNVPATVKFLSFQNALSSVSIDALCTYLRAQNLTFKDASDGSSPRTDSSSSLSSCSSTRHTSQGLQGLAITHTALHTEDVKSICDLLTGGNNSAEGRSDSYDRKTPTSEELLKCENVRLSEHGGFGANIIRSCSIGLLHLDLSFNRLSDEQCSNIILAAMGSPLQSLELKGNNIHRGLYFCPALLKYLQSPQCQLEYLGASENGFINSTFRSVLDCCQNDCSLVGLDLSHNDLTSSDNNCSRVRDFLKRNKSLRLLDLSNNRFTDGMARIFHLGLLENESLILLRLNGNISMNEREMYLVRGKLKANRERYVHGHSHPSNTKNFVSSHGGPRTDRDIPSKRRSESSALSARLSFKSAKKSSSREATSTADGFDSESTRSHDRTQSDLSEHDKNDISSLFHAPVVATQVVDCNADDGVPMSTAYLSTKPPQTICVLFSAPLAWIDTRNQLHPIQTLDYPGERETLITAFREASRDITVRFDFATTDTLRTALSLGVKALHFSGHGHPHCLNFEDGRSGLQFVTMDALRSLLQAGGNQLNFVFVSACHSRQAGEAFVGAGVPHVVCVTVEAQLLDAAAVAFTRAFYLALAVGRSVQDSFDIGKQAVITSPYVPNSLVEGEKFLLLPEDSDHSSPIFDADRANEWPVPGASLQGLTGELVDNSYLPHVPEDFEGREVDMYSIIRILLSRRLVSIVGENGVGKSSVAIAVCWYLCDRRKFEHGAIFVRLRGVSSHEDFLLSIFQALKSSSHRVTARFESVRKGKDMSSLSIREKEEFLLDFLATFNSLVVLSNMTGLLTASSETLTDLKMFLTRLFDRCPKIKVLTTSGEVIGMTGLGITEHVVSLGPLTLYNSLRLFARLSSSLATAASKVKFVKSLLISDQSNVTLESRELSSAAAQILYMLGGGHPSKIVKIACESSADRIEHMLSKGRSIIEKASSHSSLDHAA